MDKNPLPDRTRRRFLKKAAVTTTAAVAAPVLAVTATDAFAAKVPKSAVQYQDKPKNNQKCSQCQLYIPAKSGGKGKCKAVSGAIAPEGWCSLFQPKS